MTGMRQLYRQELISLAPDGLAGMHAEVRGSDYEPVRLLGEVLSTLGCSAGEGLRLHLGAGGRRLSLHDPEAGYVWPERVLALGCLMELEDGRDLALPYDAPLAIEEMARALRPPGAAVPVLPGGGLRCGRAASGGKPSPGCGTA